MNQRCVPLHTQLFHTHERLGGPTHNVGLSVAMGKKSDGRATMHAVPYHHDAYQKFCDAMAAHFGRGFVDYREPMVVVHQHARRELKKPPKHAHANDAAQRWSHWAPAGYQTTCPTKRINTRYPQ